MHLLNRYPKAVINVVESEKTAIICAIAYGAMDMNLWMACGGKTMLSNERMEPLFAQKRQIVLWPDTDGLDEWAEWIKLMNRPEISIQREFFARYYREELDGKKADVADLLIRWMDESIQGTHHYENAEVVAELTEKTERLTTGTVQAIEEPFIDPEELADPRLRWMRETLRQRYNFNKRNKTNDRRTKTT
jgi:DNA primase